MRRKLITAGIVLLALTSATAALAQGHSPPGLQNDNSAAPWKPGSPPGWATEHGKGVENRSWTGQPWGLSGQRPQGGSNPNLGTTTSPSFGPSGGALGGGIGGGKGRGR